MYPRHAKWLIAISVTGFLVSLSGCDQNGSRSQMPGLDYKADAQSGSKLFSVNCSRCHGVNISGSDKGPSLLDETYSPGHHGDLAFHWAVSKGVKQHHWHFGDMPAIAGLSGENVADIIAYVRNEQRKMGIK